MLNNTPLLPFTPFTFSGEEKINCSLIGNDPVIDLGIIYRPDKISAELLVFSVQPQSAIHLSCGMHFLFLAEGHETIINNHKLQVGDTIKIESQKDLSLDVISQGEAVFFHIEISSPI